MGHTGRIRAIVIATALWLVAANVEAGQITVTWEASPEPSVRGYIVYYGVQPREVADYDGAVDVGNLLFVQFDLPGDQYFFAVRSYDADGNLSPYSLELGDTPTIVLTNP